MKYAAITLVFIFMTMTSVYGKEFNFIEECCEDTYLNYEDNVEDNVEDDKKKKSTISLYPSPATIGRNVTINNIDVGQVISIYKQSGKFIKSQVIDLDKQIYTSDLQSGEYIIRANALYLKLLVE